jgi:hypothetical protein
MGRDSKTLIGIDDTMRWADMAIKTTKKKIATAMNSSAKKMIESANSRNGGFKGSEIDLAKRGIKADVTITETEASLVFWIDPSVTGGMLSSGYNRLWLRNDGTYGNYRRGIISPSAITVGGKKGTGYKSRDFMGRTWRTQYKALDKRINKAMDGIR